MLLVNMCLLSYEKASISEVSLPCQVICGLPLGLLPGLVEGVTCDISQMYFGSFVWRLQL